MNALAGASVGDADIDRPITAADAPVAKKERRVCVKDFSASPLEAEAETAERWLRRDGRETTTTDVDVDAIDVDGFLLGENAAGSLSIVEAIFSFLLLFWQVLRLQQAALNAEHALLAATRPEKERAKE